MAETPLVKSILAEFKGAKIETLTRKAPLEEENNNNEYEFISEDFI